MSALPFLLIIALAGYAFLASWPPERKPQDDDDACHYERFEQ